MKQAFLRNDGLDWAVFDNLIGYLDFFIQVRTAMYVRWFSMPSQSYIADIITLSL